MFIYNLFSSIVDVFKMIIEKIYSIFYIPYEMEYGVLYNIYKSILDNSYNNDVNHIDTIRFDKKIKLGLLTNEIPPIVYGGVATWIVNFIKMFENDKEIEVVPIFLAYQDELPDECYNKYKNIRVINREEDIIKCFSDIEICVNNLWIALDTIVNIKRQYPNISMVSVCHSLIRMENITNMGSCYTNNFNQQEITFQNSDYVVLISKAEEQYYNKFGYNLFETKTRVIYNSYTPKYDDIYLDINYESNDVGYIGRHVPRKRPEIPLLAVNTLENNNVKV